MPTKRSPKLIIINFTICGLKGIFFFFLFLRNESLWWRKARRKFMELKSSWNAISFMVSCENFLLLFPFIVASDENTARFYPQICNHVNIFISLFSIMNNTHTKKKRKYINKFNEKKSDKELDFFVFSSCELKKKNYKELN